MALHEKKIHPRAGRSIRAAKHDGLMHSIPRSEVPDMDLKTDMIVGLITPEGRQVPARIAQFDEQQVTMDLNHPLAGETLTFEIEVVGISSTSTEQSMNCPSGCDCSGGGCAE